MPPFRLRAWLSDTRVLAECVPTPSRPSDMARLASPSADLALVAREIAMDAILGLYTVGVATHIPGVSNVLPDDLSRLWAPDRHRFPRELRGLPEVPVPDLGPNFWKTTGLSQRGGEAGHRRKRPRR